MAQSSRLNLYFAVFVVNVGAFSLGSQYNWTSPALPKLTAKDSWLPVNTAQASWIGSLISLSSILGPFIGGFTVDKFGRKASVTLSVFLDLIAWLVLYFTTAVWHIYLSRVIAGLGGGIVFTSVPLYIAEISEVDVRSALGATFNFSFSAGYLVGYIFGPIVSYWQLIYISCVAPIIYLVLVWSIPESPYVHVMKHDIQSAEKSLRMLRKGCSNEAINAELEIIQESVQQAMKEKGTVIELIGTLGNRKGLLMSCGAMCVQQLSGINGVLFYLETIFNQAGNLGLSSANATIVVALILICAAGIAVPLVKAFGIKNMLIFSATGMFLFQTLTAIYFYLYSKGLDLNGIRWLPVVNLVGYVLSYSSGYGPLPMAVKGEVFSPNVKGISAAIAASTSWALSFLVTKTFPEINDKYNLYTVFAIFAVFSFIGILFSVFIMIDTRGMSLQDILDLLNNTKKISENVGLQEITQKHCDNNERS